METTDGANVAGGKVMTSGSLNGSAAIGVGEGVSGSMTSSNTGAGVSGVMVGSRTGVSGSNVSKTGAGASVLEVSIAKGAGVTSMVNSS